MSGSAVLITNNTSSKVNDYFYQKKKSTKFYQPKEPHKDKITLHNDTNKRKEKIITEVLTTFNEKH